MAEITPAHKGRLAIRAFKITTDALLLRGHYKLSGKSGQTLEEALRNLSPEIYGTMNNPKIVELKGLEYVLDRLPQGIESCTRIVMTAQEDLEGTSFEKIQPLKRRRISYRVSDHEMCFIITRGLSEIYDILTHLTFLYIEARKIHSRIKDAQGNPSREWQELEKATLHRDAMSSEELDQVLWNLSILIGRTYHETKETYNYLENNKKEKQTNSGLLQIIRGLGENVEAGVSQGLDLTVYFTPVLANVIIHQIYGKKWAAAIKNRLSELGLAHRPLHIFSANLHSFLKTLYAYGAVKAESGNNCNGDLYEFIQSVRHHSDDVKQFASEHGFYELTDSSGANVDCQLIDTACLGSVQFHPDLDINRTVIEKQKPVLLVMDYAFGTQAFELLDELLQPPDEEESPDIRSISIMGKAGTLTGAKGDIMLATAHVLEGGPHTYIVHNDLVREDFDPGTALHVGPMITVYGTSLQNRDVLEKFKTTTWRAVGLEMEGGHYQRAIDAAMVRGHISPQVKVRYAYYASDNPLVSGQTLAAGGLGEEGIRPTYMITKVFLEKILAGEDEVAPIEPNQAAVNDSQLRKSVTS